MKRNIFFALLVSLLFFGSRAYATDEDFVGGIGYFDGDETNITVSDDESISFPTIPLLVSEDALPHDLNGKSISISPESLLPSNSLRAGTRSASSNNTTPNTALTMPPNSNYTDTLDYSGHQSWFYTSVSQNGQFTMHLTVPPTTAVDYDLYVYKYNASTGSLSSFKASERNAGADEHISFMATAGDIYFTLVVSYTGSSTTAYTLRNDFTTSPGAGEVDDFPENARVVTPNTVGLTGIISRACDEDFFKFTVPASANNAIISISMNINDPSVGTVVYGELYNSSLSFMGEFVVNSFVSTPVSPGDYYIRVQSMTKTAYYTNIDYNYKVLVNTVNSGGTIAQVLGRNTNNTKIAYMINAGALWVNSSQKIATVGLTFSHTVTTPQKTTYLSVTSLSALTRGIFGNYGSTLTSNVSNAICLLPSGNINFLNSVHFTSASSSPLQFGGTIDNAAQLSSGFIFDLDTGAMVDFYSPYNGYYNSDINNGQMGNYGNSFSKE
jgi:hypothetical protein